MSRTTSCQEETVWAKSLATILTPQFQEFGIGTACIGDDTYWCAVFGKPKG